MRPTRSFARALPAPEWAALAGFGLFTAVAVAGYATFGLHPQWLPDHPLARAIYPVSFPYFARLQVLLGALAVGVALYRRAGAVWFPALAAVCGVSFLAEHLGTGIGFPFGGYGYTGLLGPRVGGRVPALIPLSWFAMAVPSYAFARAVYGRRDELWPRLLSATGFLVAWDLALDPAMSFLTPYWSWEATGPYYGMPWSNLFGWFTTGMLIMAALELLGARRWIPRVPLPWHVGFYAVVLLMPLGMLAAAGAWLAVFVTAGAVLVASLPAAVRGRVGSGSPATPAFPPAGAPE